MRDKAATKGHLLHLFGIIRRTKALRVRWGPISAREGARKLGGLHLQEACSGRKGDRIHRETHSFSMFDASQCVLGFLCSAWQRPGKGSTLPSLREPSGHNHHDSCYAAEGTMLQSSEHKESEGP